MTDPARSICAERCAEFGDPPCYEIWKDLALSQEDFPPAWEPCAPCLTEAGIETPEPIDPNAAIRNLL